MDSLIEVSLPDGCLGKFDVALPLAEPITQECSGHACCCGYWSFDEKWGCVDDIASAVGETLAIAMTADGWELIKNSVVGWWQRFRPEDAEQVGPDLDQLREDAVAAQADGDTAMQQALVSEWQLRLHRLVNGNPEMREALKRLFEDELVPALSDHDQQQVRSLVQKTSVVGSNNTTAVAGRDLNFGSTPSA